jgi:hypothetical protein
VTQTHREAYRIASREFFEVLSQLRAVLSNLTALERELDRSGAPWTPGRLPDWRP